LTYDQLHGNIVTYDHVTGNEVSRSAPIAAVLAFFRNGTALAQDEGPLRLAFLGSEGLITEGHNWVKSVVKMEILPAVREWALTLNGTLIENMSRSTFESGVNCHGETWTDNLGQVWKGIPLWLLVGRVDDLDVHDTGPVIKAYNRTLADIGYKIRIIATDNYYIELNSTRVKLDNSIIVASEMNGTALPERYWPLRLIGSGVSSSENIRAIKEIKIIF